MGWETPDSGDTGVFKLERLVFRDQGFYDGIQIAVQNSRQVVGGQANAVIGDAVLGKVVGAYLFCTFSRPHLRTSRLCNFTLAFLYFDLVQPRAQNSHRANLVLQL